MQFMMNVMIPIYFVIWKHFYLVCVRSSYFLGIFSLFPFKCISIFGKTRVQRFFHNWESDRISWNVLMRIFDEIVCSTQSLCSINNIRAKLVLWKYMIHSRSKWNSFPFSLSVCTSRPETCSFLSRENTIIQWNFKHVLTQPTWLQTNSD